METVPTQAATAPEGPKEVAQAPSAPITANDIIQRQAKEIKPAQVSEPAVKISLDDVKDPVARTLLESKLKEANDAISKKFGEIGGEKAQLLREMEKLQSEINKPWTPQRIQELMIRPDFISAAQQAAQASAPENWTGTTDQWSNLSPQEQAQFRQLAQSQRALEAQLNQMQLSQVDAKLQTKFPDYNPKDVDSFIDDALNGRISNDQLREFVYKAKNFDRHVEQGYKYGLLDKNGNIQEKLNASTNLGINASLAEEKVERKPGESNKNLFTRIAERALLQAKERAAQK